MDVTDVVFPDELSAVDYMMFRADADVRSRTSMMLIETLDAVPDLDLLRDQIERATRVVPRLRQRVVAPLLPLAPARWVVDPDFSLDYHFRRVALPAPQSFRELLDFAETLHETPLDPGRPLWEVVLVEGLDDGESKAALCWKFSHTVTDGVSGMVLDQMIHQQSRDPEPAPMPPLPVPQDVTALDLTNDAVRGLPATVLRGAVSRVGAAVRILGSTVRQPAESASAAARLIGDLRRLAGPPPAEPSPLLRRRGLNHRIETLDFPLADLRAAAKTQGCSVNDAYLAALAAVLRRYHDGLGVPVEAIGVAMPVSARDATSTGVGNEWSAVTLRLPVADPDPARRMRAVREQVLTARTASGVNPAALIAPLVSWLPQQLLAGLDVGALGFDIQVSNVPGQAADRYIAGARITRSVPIGPVPGTAMMATMVSFSGRCFVGVHYDTASFTDTGLLAASLQAGFDEVISLGRRRRSPARKPRERRAAPLRTVPSTAGGDL